MEELLTVKTMSRTELWEVIEVCERVGSVLGMQRKGNVRCEYWAKWMAMNALNSRKSTSKLSHLESVFRATLHPILIYSQDLRLNLIA